MKDLEPDCSWGDVSNISHNIPNLRNSFLADKLNGGGVVTKLPLSPTYKRKYHKPLLAFAFYTLCCFCVAHAAELTYENKKLTSFGSTSCSASAGSCISGKYDDVAPWHSPTQPNNHRVGDLTLTNNGSSGSIKGNFTSEYYIKNITAYNYSLDISSLNLSGGGIINSTFNSSVITGGYKNMDGAPETQPSNITFNKGLSATGANHGYAFVGTLNTYNGVTNWTFNDDANFKGDINAGNQGTNYGRNTITFNNSSVEGNINNQNVSIAGISPQAKYSKASLISQNITFNGNSSKGYALKGNINVNYGHLTTSFTNAKMIGDISLDKNTKDIDYDGGSAVISDSTINYNASTLEGKITIKNGAVGKINFSNNSTQTGEITNTGGQLTLNFHSSNHTGNFNLSGGSTNILAEGKNGASTSINANNGSKLNGSLIIGSEVLKGDFGANSILKGSVTTKGGSNELSFGTGSNISAVFANSSGATKLTLDKTNATASSFNLTGGDTTINAKNGSTLGDFNNTGNLHLTLDGSSSGNIINTSAGSSLVFTNTGVAPSSLADGLKVGNIDFTGKISGSMNYYNAGNINNHSNSGSTLTINNSKLGDINNLNALTLSASNTGAISNFNTLSITNSNTGDINNANKQGGSLSLNLSNNKVGNVYFGGTMNATLSNSSTKTMKIQYGSGTINLSNHSNIGDVDLSSSAKMNFTIDNSTAGSYYLYSSTITTINAKNGSTLGKIGGGQTDNSSGKLTLTIDNSSTSNITNTNKSSTLNFTNTSANKSSATNILSIGNINFAGKMSGALSYYKIGNINNQDFAGSNFSINNSSAGNIGRIDTFTITNSSAVNITSIKTLNLTNSSANILDATSMTLNNTNKKVGRITAGTLNATLNNSTTGDIILSLDSKNTINATNNSTLGAIESKGNANNTFNLTSSSMNGLTAAKGTTNVSLDNSTMNGNISTSGTLDANFKNKSILTGALITTGGEASYYFADGSRTLGGNISAQNAVSSTTFGSDVSKIAFSSDTPKSSNTQEIIKYLGASNISNYAGNITTNAGGINKVDFKDAIYLGGNIATNGGTTNVSLDFSDAFLKKLQSNAITTGLLYAGQGPSFSLTSSNGGTNNIALSGDIKGVATINYDGGNANIIFADTRTAPSSTSNKIGDTTHFDDSSAYNPSDTSKNQVMVNGYTYNNGIIIRLDANKANSLLKPYRDILKSNSATFGIDKIGSLSAPTPNVYSANISGVMVGDVDSLPTKAVAGESKKTYNANFSENAVFAGRVNIANTNTSSSTSGVDINFEMSEGSKVILSDNSAISLLSENSKNPSSNIDTQELANDTLLQNNTVIDLATGGNPLLGNVISGKFLKLTIGEIKNLNNVVFRVGYNPNANANDPASEKSGHLIINKVTNTKSSDPLIAYLQVFQSAPSNTGEDITSKHILVASVANDTSTGKPMLQFANTSDVKQGYNVIKSGFISKVETSADGTSNAKTETKEASPSSSAVVVGATSSPTSSMLAAVTPTYTNYYLGSISASIEASARYITEAGLSTNYAIFLNNINDINKRLGELRNNPYEQGAWGRVFSGMSNNNQAEAFTDYFTNVQGGYDFSIAHDGARSYFGGALSYGYNSIDGKDFGAKAHMVEVGAYYSFVSDDGFYSDSILKYSYIFNTLSLKNNQLSDDNFNAYTTSLGEEFGYRWNFLIKQQKSAKHSLYLEPQVEVVGGYIGSSGFSQENGKSYLDANIDNLIALRARAGGVIGYRLQTSRNQTDFRVGLSYVGDFVFGGMMHLKTDLAQANNQLKDNHMGLVSVGINSVVSEKWRVYADVDTTFLGQHFNQNYLVSVGARYSFGKKTSSEQYLKLKQKTEKTKALAIQRKLAKEAKEKAEYEALRKEYENVPAGVYWEVYTLREPQDLTEAQKEFLKQYPYAISYTHKTIKEKGKKKSITLKHYLFGAFSSKKGAMKSKDTAIKITNILNKNTKIKPVIIKLNALDLFKKRAK